MATTDTGKIRRPTGGTYYLKLWDPWTFSPWATGILAMDGADDNGVYTFSNMDTAKVYELYKQLGGSPADTDTADGIAKLLTGGGTVGPGSTDEVVTIKKDGVVIAGADVWVTTDLAGTNVIAGVLISDANGIVTFKLDPGTYYIWAQKAGVNFSAVNPCTATVV